ncbi:formylmethanofuran dehydrogenase subunit C [Candidatus Methylospira mobilis]|uniref:Formylmethanofuran dehydrogenase subunit C n=1 Tax=Candidatus Methylospira mobilis TaxID=1808979 RepID=A0A5Q0BI11_9GAMM|nr:formylmethanofuran dehydrogenase subunit C [Candidatus Methylospira mobilis]QFY41768.1 formylmethanofuran dehydrogenase subunit C [Candidatus Methylospira mobilis]WNV06629.1 formylmethanofuran dehydrogenase subunit C [Candidatus Methylospira mobilis]
MTALTFTLKIEPRQRIDVSPLIPQQLDGKTVAEISAIELQSGNRKLRVDEVFTTSGSDSRNIRFLGAATAKLDFIGKGLTEGEIQVEGNVGSYAGMYMKGGRLLISGNTDAYAACEMKSGELTIDGDAGDYLGAALPGNRKGMQGGIVIVRGNAGHRVGDHMRRGSILIEGNAGDYLGTRMVAGTIGVLGTVGANPGYAMRRGTLLLLTALSQVPATFNDCGAHTLGFLPLLLKGYRGYRTRFAELAGTVKRVRRYAGDMAGLGKGEILVVL